MFFTNLISLLLSLNKIQSLLLLAHLTLLTFYSSLLRSKQAFLFENSKAKVKTGEVVSKEQLRKGKQVRK
jgi:hypothetical protein